MVAKLSGNKIREEKRQILIKQFEKKASSINVMVRGSIFEVTIYTKDGTLHGKNIKRIDNKWRTINPAYLRYLYS